MGQAGVDTYRTAQVALDAARGGLGVGRVVGQHLGPASLGMRVYTAGVLANNLYHGRLSALPGNALDVVAGPGTAAALDGLAHGSPRFQESDTRLRAEQDAEYARASTARVAERDRRVAEISQSGLSDSIRQPIIACIRAEQEAGMNAQAQAFLRDRAAMAQVISAREGGENARPPAGISPGTSRLLDRDLSQQDFAAFQERQRRGQFESELRTLQQRQRTFGESLQFQPFRPPNLVPQNERAIRELMDRQRAMQNRDRALFDAGLARQYDVPNESPQNARFASRGFRARPAPPPTSFSPTPRPSWHPGAGRRQTTHRNATPRPSQGRRRATQRFSSSGRRPRTATRYTSTRRARGTPRPSRYSRTFSRR